MIISIKLLVITSLLLSLGISFIHAASETDTSRLRKDLLTGYDKYSRPVQNHRDTTRVKVNFILKGFDLDERKSIFNMHAWTVLVWEDGHLKWDPKSYGNITRVHFAAHELWQPDLTVYNNADKSEIDHFGNTRLIVYNSSHVVWVPPTKFQVPCQTNLRKWPYDTQTCGINIGSWAHDGTMLDIVTPANISTMDITDFRPNREWELVDNSFIKRIKYFVGVPYPDIVLTLNFARKSSSHTACVVIPGLAIAAAILIAFWLPPGSSERLSILLVTILINVLYLYYVYSLIPNNGDSVPLVLLFYRDSLFMLAFALVWTVCLRYLAATKRDSPVPLPSFIMGFLESLPAKILCLDPRPTTGRRENTGAEGNEQSDGTGTANPFGSGVEKKNPFQDDWAWLAHLLDRVAFMVYLVIYLIFYLALL
ncbi:Acetylcholine receptor subunit alpha-type acr-16 [Orchesella cincta]|uniref:Acetylcholine receptor subunit alpha-type acr-16 n=1 Tax=Orchesella cincta TaxID=48709 RepID=A0A1D2MUU7_ORCCI|nr:Acetylcholine receptor subunit alpha-type acr-16 [Orchesella cincta]